MNEMIERVAKAIARSYIKDEVPYVLDEEIDKAVDKCYHEWINSAKAAILAMREPTRGMINAWYVNNYGDPIPGWQAMIDKALE